MLQNKETPVQIYQKMLNHNAKKSPQIEFEPFSHIGKMGMDNFWLSE